MKRLFWVSIVLILLLSSCANVTAVAEGDSTSSSYLLSLLETEENRETRYNYIYALYTEGEYEKVIAEAALAYEMYPEYTRFLKIKALAEKKTGRDELYSETLGLVISKEGYDEDLRNLYLESLLTLGERERALEFSKETIALYPENREALTLLSENSRFYSWLLTTLDDGE